MSRKDKEQVLTPEIDNNGITNEMFDSDFYITHEDMCAQTPELDEKVYTMLYAQKDDPEFAAYQRERLPELRKTDPHMAKIIEEIFGTK